ncbi:acyloxyacyl hydrolase [Parabacteroides sp. OttesenSCG-928-G21]|nr:acyloxyacyl hydrolase [Parabacteroides sp. OttesenSCG-928-G21]
MSIVLLLTFFSGEVSGQIFSDSTANNLSRSPRFVAFNTMGGVVLPTNDYIRAGNSWPPFVSLSLKYAVASAGDKWQDYAYGMPYYGIGLYAARFFEKGGLGSPISVFLFQGGDLAEYSRKWSLKYELNLGMSFGWKPYDVFDNPDNIALGSSVNAHIGANVYMKHKLSDVIDLNFGLGLTHFSNGAMQLPNKGLNMIAPFVEIVYNIHPIQTAEDRSASLIPPLHEDRMDYDLSFTSTTRQIRVDTVGTGLPTRLLDKNFKVFGFSYAALFVRDYKYKWGPSIELVYDESSDVKVWRQLHPEDGQFYDRVKLGAFHKRITLGLSIKGELTFPYVSFFANLGYNILHGNDYDYRLYQIIGAKAYLKDNIYGTFGIRASRFSKAQYLMWSVGYTIKGKTLKKKGIIEN